jgi:ABC-type polysaccharide/polyol phosphate transport system ATPase subunit
MAALDLQQVGVDFPLFFAGDRSFKWKLIGAMSAHNAVHRKTTIRALDQVTLSVKPGTRLALLGGNSAGKTTLLRVMAGLLVPTSGQASNLGRVISLLGTGTGIDPVFTARQTIIGQGLLLGFPYADCMARLQRAINFGDLEDILDMPVNTLGQGHQVRVALSSAAAYDAEILLIDEMLEHLAPQFIDRLCSFINTDMQKDSIVVIAERSKSLLGRICNHAALLDCGRLVEQSTLSQMINRHSNHLTQ